MASECARADVAEKRRVWIEKRRPRMRRQPGRLVFIDETSLNTKMTRLRGRRLKANASYGKWGTQTLIAGLRHEGPTPPWVIHGAMNRAAFNIYVETQLARRSRQATSSSSTTSPSTRAPGPKPLSGREARGCSSCPNTLPT